MLGFQTPDAPDSEIVLGKDDLRVVKPPLDSPDPDIGEIQNKFESLGQALRATDASSVRSSISQSRPLLHRLPSSNIPSALGKSRAEREEAIRRQWERERSLSRARARARSPSVLGGRRVRSPSITRSRSTRHRRPRGDVGSNGAESLMQVLGRGAQSVQHAQEEPTKPLEPKPDDEMPLQPSALPQEEPAQASVGLGLDAGEARDGAVAPDASGLNEFPFNRKSCFINRLSPQRNRKLMHCVLLFLTNSTEPTAEQVRKADQDYEYEFELPTRLPPIPQIQSLSFANFRTIGTRRTQEEAVRGKFVTSQRMYHVLRNAPRLKRLAMTEYVDSALAIEVIEEIFLRGYDHGYDGEPEWERKRRSGFEAMEAIDFTGCVSHVFHTALEEFVERWLIHPKERRRRRREREMSSVPTHLTTDSVDPERGDDDGRGRSRVVHGFGGLSADDHLRLAEEEDVFYEVEDSQWVRPQFTFLQRLSLRGCVTLSWDVIATLVESCPNLTHLDLSFTRVSPATLQALTDMPDCRLVALSLARSTRLTSESVRNFLCEAPAARTIVDLNLFGDMTYLSPLTALDLEYIIRHAPCFQNHQLRYLDLSASPIAGSILKPDVFPEQPGLRSLGLSHIPYLQLDDVTQFVLKCASNLEILTLTHSSTQADLPMSLPALHTMMTLHGKLINPLTSPPFRIMSGPAMRGPHQDSPTRLRVIELSETVRKALGRSGGSLDWRVIKSKGGRGWFVDVSAGWVREYDPALGRRVYKFQRGLDKDHTWRRYLNAIADAEGKVGSSVGWHSRKMEILRGLGMMAREEGLYGAGAFAFEG